jgi:hypothetical protein
MYAVRYESKYFSNMRVLAFPLILSALVLGAATFFSPPTAQAAPCIPDPDTGNCIEPGYVLDNTVLVSAGSMRLAPGTSQHLVITVDPQAANVTGIAKLDIIGENVRVHTAANYPWETDSCGAEVTAYSWCCELWTYGADQEYNYDGQYVTATNYDRVAEIHHPYWSFNGHNNPARGSCCNGNPYTEWVDFVGRFSGPGYGGHTAKISADMYADGTCRASWDVR